MTTKISLAFLALALSASAGCDTAYSEGDASFALDSKMEKVTVGTFFTTDPEHLTKFGRHLCFGSTLANDGPHSPEYDYKIAQPILWSEAPVADVSPCVKAVGKTRLAIVLTRGEKISNSFTHPLNWGMAELVHPELGVIGVYDTMLSDVTLRRLCSEKYGTCLADDNGLLTFKPYINQ